MINITDGGIDVRKAKLVDVNRIAYVHRIAFPEYFLTNLGGGFLKRYYQNYICHSEGVNVVATINGEVCAFISGNYKPSTILKDFFRDNFLYVGFAVLYKIATCNPVICRGVFGRLGHVKIAFKAFFCRGDKGQQEETGAVESEEEQVGRLVSIAALPECQGTGISGQMLVFFEKQLIDLGTTEVRLSVNSDNARAIHFYKKCGWQMIKDKGDELSFAKKL